MMVHEPRKRYYGKLEDMKTKFLEKYKEYCRGSDMRGGEIFRM